MKKLFLSAILCLCAWGSANARTLSELRAELRRNIQDTHTSRARYSDATLLQYLNEAQNAVLSATWLSLETTSYELTRGTTFYSLPGDYLSANYVEFKDARGSARILEEMSLKGLGTNNSNWKMQSGVPSQYYVDMSSTSTNQLIAFIPIPGNVSSTGTVTVWYFSKTTDMSSDSDIPFNGKLNLIPYHMSIVYHATMRIKAIEKKTDDVTFYVQLFVQMITEMRDRLGSMPNYKPSMGVSR